MFAFRKDDKSSDGWLNKLNSFATFIRSHPIRTENFLDSFIHFAKVSNAENASFYVYEKKTHMFVLKKWVGQKPNRFSISGDFEFVAYMHKKQSLMTRKEFSGNTASELRQPALLYFQHTLSDVAFPLLEDEEWLGVINLDLSKVKKGESEICLFLTEIYGDFLKNWILYQRVAEQNRKYSEIDHVKQQLLANVTHELQTPLNGILGVSSALLDDPDLSDLHRGSVQLVHKSGEELHKTVNNILELMQIEAKKNQKVREKVDIFLIIKEVAMLFAETCRNKEIKFIIPKSADELFVFVQADQLRTVFMNLIGNAVKFTERGEIKISVQKNGESLHVTVSDTGIGIDRDKLKVIFEEFYQADGSHTRVFGGTGLGLSIVKKIIDLHGGRIWVDSEKGQGSAFKFTLPMYPS